MLRTIGHLELLIASCTGVWKMEVLGAHAIGYFYGEHRCLAVVGRKRKRRRQGEHHRNCSFSFLNALSSFFRFNLKLNVHYSNLSIKKAEAGGW